MRNLKTLTILFRAQHALEERIKEDVKAYDLNFTEFGVLEALYHLGPLSIQALQAKVLVAASSMTYVIEQLKHKSMIEKTPNKEDRRESLISLSTHGRAMMNQNYRTHEMHMRQFLDVLNPEEEATLQSLLKKIGHHASSSH